MTKPRSELEIRRAVTLLREQYEDLVATKAPMNERAGCLSTLAFGGWVLGEQTEEAIRFGKLVDAMRGLI